VKVYADIVQGTPEWLMIKLGVPSASMFKDVCAEKGPRGGESIGRRVYMNKLAGEIITREPMDNFTNFHMDRGSERESEDRDLYAFLKDVEPVQVGFIRNGNCGCSPDGLISHDGMWENKSALAHIQIERLLSGVLPPEHKPQCQGQLMVAQRQWVDFQSSCRGLPPLIVRVDRDERYIAAMKISINEFVDELDELVTKIRGM